MSLRKQQVLVLTFLLFFVITFILQSYQTSNYTTTCWFAGQDCLHYNKSGSDGWKYQPLEDWTIDQMMDYLMWTNSSSCLLAHDFGGVIGGGLGIDGQKAVCLDPAVAPVKTYGYWPYTKRNNKTECLVYSFGINNEWSFDEDMQEFGCRVYAFDPSMKMESHNHSSKIHFYNWGLGDRNEILPRKTPDGNDWKMVSLNSVYYSFQHDNRIIDYLKIDIEGGEWKALPQIMSSRMLNCVRQLGIEIHLIPEDATQLEVVRQRIKLIKTLEDVYGFVRFDSKYSPWGWASKVIDDYDWLGFYSFEMAFYNSKLSRRSVH